MAIQERAQAAQRSGLRPRVRDMLLGSHVNFLWALRTVRNTTFKCHGPVWSGFFSDPDHRKRFVPHNIVPWILTVMFHAQHSLGRWSVRDSTLPHPVPHNDISSRVALEVEPWRQHSCSRQLSTWPSTVGSTSCSVDSCNARRQT